MKVAIQGEPGSFHELAANHWFGSDIDLICCETFADLFEALSAGTADAGVTAIENSLYGSINEVYDLLQKHHIPIIGEVHERIHQNLITLPGATLQGITHVYSHPVALEQCKAFLDEQLPHAERIQHHDTAASVELIKQLRNPQFAAIASASAADLYELSILHGKIEDHTTNYTRFLVLRPSTQAPIGANKSSLILRTSHTPGALYKALGVFAHAGINMTKLQSRPIIGKVWRYKFYIDVETAGPQLQQCVEQITSQDCEITILGEYVAGVTSYED